MKGTYNAFLSKKNDKMPTPFRLEGASTPAIDFYDSDTDIYTGALYFSTGDAQRRLAIKQFNIDQDSASTKYADAYYLPSPAAGLTADKWYELVSTKNRYQIFPVGHCIITSTNTNPSSALGGGTWELIDKHFQTLQLSGTNVINYNSTNVSSYDTPYAIRSGHTITLKLDWNLASDSVDDQTIEVGTLNLSALGISSVGPASVRFMVSGDAPNGACICIMTTAGVISVQDTIVADGADAMTTDGTVGGTLTLNVISSRMLDSACNQFIWKRTA